MLLLALTLSNVSIVSNGEVDGGGGGGNAAESDRRDGIAETARMVCSARRLFVDVHHLGLVGRIPSYTIASSISFSHRSFAARSAIKWCSAELLSLPNYKIVKNKK